MSALVSLVKGFAGKPSHAPLTDVSVGAYTIGVAMLVVGALGFEQEAMAKGALLAISGGLIVAVPTSLTGLLDWSDLAKGTAKRTVANFHLAVMLAATAVFAATWVAQRPGYLDGEVTTLGLLLGIVAFSLLIVGGTLGGALAYVYGVRVVKRDVSVGDALIPGRLEERSASGAQAGPAVAREEPPARGPRPEAGVAPAERPVSAPTLVRARDGSGAQAEPEQEHAEPEQEHAEPEPEPKPESQLLARAQAAAQAARYRL